MARAMVHDRVAIAPVSITIVLPTALPDTVVHN